MYTKKLNALSALIIGILMLLPGYVYAQGSNSNPSAAAASAASAAPSYSSLSSNFGSVQNTLSGSCKSSSSFLIVTARPLSDGDMTLSVSLNGNTYNPPMTDLSGTPQDGISGLCSNGYIVCSNGSWSNCAFYRWEWINGQLTVQQLINPAPQQVAVNGMSSNGLGGTTQTIKNQSYSSQNCECINNSCDNGGTPLSSLEQEQILAELGGGINGALNEGNSGMVIGTALYNSSNTQINYNGYDSGKCNNGSSSTVGNMTSLYNQGGNGISSEVSTGAINNNSNQASSSYFGGLSPEGTLNNIQQETFGSNTPETCNIENTVTFQYTMSYFLNEGFYPSSPISNNQVGVGAGGGSSCANGSCWGSSQNTVTLSTNNPQSTCSPQSLPGGITLSGSTMSGSGACSGTITLSSSTGVNPGGQISCNLGDNGCNTGGTLYFSGNGNTVYISGSDSGAITLTSSFQYYPVYSQPQNNCASLQNNSNCKLQTEQVCNQNNSNCYNIVSNFTLNTNQTTNGNIPSCPANYTFEKSTNTCIESVAQSYQCPGGFTLSGSQCSETFPAGLPTSYYDSQCTGGTVSGSTCTETATLACPTGSQLSGAQCVSSVQPTYTSSLNGSGFTWTQQQTDQNPGMGPITWTINMGGGSVNVNPSESTDTINYGTLTTSSASYGGIDFPYVNQTYLCQGAASYNFNTMNQQETQVQQHSTVSSNNTVTFNTNNALPAGQNADSNVLVGVAKSNVTQPYACELQSSTTNTNISNTSTLQNNTQTQVSGNKNYTYDIWKDCSESSQNSNSSCVSDPNNSGEYLCCNIPSGDTLLSPCNNSSESSTNQNNFINAVVQTTIMTDAAKDMICSQ